MDTFGKWKHCSTILKVGTRDDWSFHSPATLPMEKEPPEPTLQEDGWGPVWMLSSCSCVEVEFTPPPPAGTKPLVIVGRYSVQILAGPTTFIYVLHAYSISKSAAICNPSPLFKSVILPCFSQHYKHLEIYGRVISQKSSQVQLYTKAS
jgi:hypothetical protein